MKKLNKAITLVVLICFGLNSISYAAEVNSFKLAPSSNFSHLIGPEFKEAAQIQIGIRTALKDLTSLDLASLNALGRRQFTERTVFNKKISSTVYFDEVRTCEFGDQKLYTESDNYLVKAQTASGMTYHGLISKKNDGKDYDISVVPERVLAEALKKGVVKFIHDSVDKKDKDIIGLYLEHEITTENNAAIDEWIRERMEHGEYSVDNLSRSNEVLYGNAISKSYFRGEYRDVVQFVLEMLEKASVKADNMKKIADALISKPVVIIPYDNGTELPTITINNQKVMVDAHSSEFATYIFVKRHIFNNTEYILDLDECKKFIHEVGAICGLKVTVKNGKAWNLLDEAVSMLMASQTVAPSSELQNLSPVNLLDLELRNDYAAGGIENRKSIFKRVIAVVLVAVLAILPACNKSEKMQDKAVQSQSKQQSAQRMAPEVLAGANIVNTTTETQLAAEELNNRINKLLKKLATGSENDRVTATQKLIKIGEPALPILTEALENESAMMRVSLLHILWNIGDKGAAKAIMKRLKDEDAQVRSRAAIALGLMHGLTGNKEVIDSLIETLKDADEEVRANALMALGSIGGNSVSKYLIEALKDNAVEMRISAARALAKIGGKDAGLALIEALEDGDRFVSASAARSLGIIKDKRATKHLLKYLTEGFKTYGPLQMAAVESLGRIGDKEAVKPLIGLLKNGELLIRLNAVEALGLMGDKEAVKPLIELLKNEDSPIRYAILEALGLIGDSAAVPTIAEMLNDSDVDLRISAAHSLGSIADKSSCESLVKMLKYEDIWFYASEALIKAGPPAVPVLVEGLRNKDIKVIRHINRSLIKIGRPAVSPLIEALKDSNGEVRRNAATVLGFIGDKDAIKPLLESLKDKESNFIAANALCKIDQSIAPSLMEMSRRSDSVTREAIIRTLGLLGDKAALPLLIESLRDSDGVIRLQAVQALGLIGDKSTTQQIVMALRDSDKDVRIAAVKSLGWIGDNASVKLLVEALKDDDSEIRIWAAESLGMIGGKESVEPLIEALNSALIAVGNKEPADLMVESLEGKAHYSVAMKAILALGKIGDERAIKHIVDSLYSSHEFMHVFAEEALGNMGHAALPVVLDLMKNSNYEIRNAAAAVLGKIGGKEATQVLVSALYDENAEVCFYASNSLVEIGRPAVQPLIEALRYWISQKMMGDGARAVNRNIRHIIEVLESIKETDAVQPLIEALRNKDSWVSIPAAKALVSIKTNLTMIVSDEKRYSLDEIDRTEEALQSIDDVSDLINEHYRPAVRLENNEDVRKMIEALESAGNTYTEDYAIRSMVLSYEIAMPHLVMLFSGNDYSRKGGANTALVKIGPPAIPYLMEAFHVGPYYDESVRPLIEIGFPSVQSLIALLRDGDKDIRSTAVEALGSIGDKEAVDPLIGALKDNNFLVRKAAAEAILKITRKLTLVVSDRARYSMEEVLLARAALGRIQKAYPSAQVNPLASATPSAAQSNMKPMTKPITVRVISQEKQKEIDELIRQIGPIEHVGAAKELIKIGEDAIPSLLSTLKADSQNLYPAECQICGNIVYILSEIGPVTEDVVPAVLKMAGWGGDGALDLRNAAVDALVRLSHKTDNLIPILIKALEDKNEYMRESAAEALGRIKPDRKDLVPALTKLLEDKYDRVRWKATDALADLGSHAKEAAPLLVKMLDDKYPNVRWSGARALGEIGPVTNDVVPALTKALKDEDEDVRENAKEAIGKIKKAEEKNAPKESPKKSRMLNNPIAPQGTMKATEEIESVMYQLDNMRSGEQRRANTITEVLWNAGRGIVSKVQAKEELAKLAPEVEASSKERSDVYDQWLAMANLTMLGLGVRSEEKHAKPTDEDIRLIASRIRESGVEVFIPKSQFPGNAIVRYREIMESIGGQLRVYQHIEDLQAMIKNPAKSIVMAVGVSGNDMELLEVLKTNASELRFMNFEKMDDLNKMAADELDNYEAEMLSILLIARIITPEDFQNKGSSTYRMLAHLLEDYIPEGVTIENYIQDIVTNAARLIKTILKALPIAVYKAMRQSVEVLWSA